jgi:TfoX/Sxy family transcriptional regulator of competence genes
MINDAEIRMRGMQALAEELGEVGAEKFVALLHRDEFNYTDWRDKGLDQKLSLRELSKKAMEQAP